MPSALLPAAGSMALYVIVVSAQAVGRNQFDANMASSIVEIVNLGRPVLICINMMCEKMHWWKTADATDRACKAIKDSIVSKAARDHGPVTVFMTECLFYDDFQEQMQARQVKTVEDVSWMKMRFDHGQLTKCMICRLIANRLRPALHRTFRECHVFIMIS